MIVYALVREPGKGEGVADCFRSYPTYNARSRAVLDMIMARVEDDMTPYQLQEFHDSLMPLDLPELMVKLNERSKTGTIWYPLNLDVEVPVQPVAEEPPAEDGLTTYMVCVQQFVEEVAVIEVRAASPEAAKAEVERMEEEGELDADWEDGDDIVDFGVYNVQTEDGEIVWER